MNDSTILALVVFLTYLLCPRNLQLNSAVIAKDVFSMSVYLKRYATSLALVHLTNLFSPDSFALSSPSTTRIEDDVLPLSVHTLYTDELFFSAKDSSPPSMTSAWLALDDDDCAFLYAFLQPCVLKSMPLY
ncbi:hypothetical protein RIR_jg1153.t1 [Rhizophagus irregularis DAOM 181602=DAOM 197198]|nr:hypothetical protein RIR_jg1153.t1 [Rhizophagus irregularis DAOM 181602=DAOM 197198]